MSYTKQQFVSAAFEELGLAAHSFDMQPEDFQVALRRLDTMMADWNGKGIRLGYPLSSISESALSQSTNVPDYANECIITNLAARLAPLFGKQLSRDTKVIARQTYNSILSRSTVPIEMQMPATLPTGAGHKQHMNGGRVFMPVPSDTVKTGGDGDLDFY